MYTVSAAYKAAMKEAVQYHDLRGTVGNVAFTAENLLSFSITNDCSGSDKLEIGTVTIGELKAVFTGLNADRYAWKGAVITPEFGLNIGNTYEYIPLGVFTVSDVSITQSGVEVTAYDNMAKLDRTPAVSRSIGLTPYQMAKRYTDRVGLELGQTAEEFAALPNGTETLYIAVEDSGKTGRDVVAWLGQVLGCFCTAGRDGKIYFRPYTRTVVDTLDPAHRWQGAKFGDYVTRYSEVRCTVCFW